MFGGKDRERLRGAAATPGMTVGTGPAGEGNAAPGAAGPHDVLVRALTGTDLTVDLMARMWRRIAVTDPDDPWSRAVLAVMLSDDRGIDAAAMFMAQPDLAADTLAAVLSGAAQPRYACFEPAWTPDPALRTMDGRLGFLPDSRGVWALHLWDAWLMGDTDRMGLCRAAIDANGWDHPLIRLAAAYGGQGLSPCGAPTRDA
ncbi:hypothetical protein D2E22_0206 [Bifidobacterium castoris]|uniref:Uncharacterized protein n=2 Tax=Bifidobacterium castoris TaxID=2306972 RepID=A0A430FA89_9BIFI|nr:hypothetical protein D2E22_0206 [Bifidobacterium castoris]